MRRKRIAVVVVTAVGLAAAALPGVTGDARADAALSGEEIAPAISGKRVYLQVPLGGEFPLHYRENGVVDGSGEAVGLGRYMKPADSGRWWVEGDLLCQQWEAWYDGRRFCFTLEMTGTDRLAWQRDDGLSGTARIGN